LGEETLISFDKKQPPFLRNKGNLLAICEKNWGAQVLNTVTSRTVASMPVTHWIKQSWSSPMSCKQLSTCMWHTKFCS